MRMNTNFYRRLSLSNNIDVLRDKLFKSMAVNGAENENDEVII